MYKSNNEDTKTEMKNAKEKCAYERKFICWYVHV